MFYKYRSLFHCSYALNKWQTSIQSFCFIEGTQAELDLTTRIQLILLIYTHQA